MTFSWRDTVALVSMLIVTVLALALMLGAFENIESRWALSTFAVLLLGGTTGLLTGTTTMMKRIWSSVSLYALTVAALVITIVNAYLNSEVWFIGMTVAYLLIGIEFLATDLHGRAAKSGLSTRGGTV